MSSTILGIIASGGAAAGGGTSFESIATANGTGSSGVITFSSIPSTFKHLQVRIYQLTASSSDDIDMTINNDTGSNYALGYFYGSGTGVAAQPVTAINLIRVAGVYFSATTTNPNAAIVDLVDYTSSNYKVARIFEGISSTNNTGSLAIDSGLWKNTSTINRLDFTSGVNFATTTTIALYGIKESA